jgi:hypothetical protein
MASPGSGITDKAVSVEAWIQSTGNNVNANLVFAGPESPDFGIWIQGGRFFAGIWNSAGTQFSAISASSPTPGQWFHVAMTCDFDAGKVVKFSINGILNCKSAATGTAIKSDHTTIDIGGRTPHSWYFNGIIDEVKLHNRSLSEEKIVSLVRSLMRSHDLSRAGKMRYGFRPSRCTRLATRKAISSACS